MARPRKIDQLRPIETTDTGCDEQIVHVDAVRAVRASMPSATDVAVTSGLFTALGDPTRLRLMTALVTHPLCVCDLAASLGMTQSAVSHQLRVLRRHGLVKAQREGRRVYYQLDDDHVVTLIGQALAHGRHAGTGEVDD